MLEKIYTNGQRSYTLRRKEKEKEEEDQNEDGKEMEWSWIRHI